MLCLCLHHFLADFVEATRDSNLRDVRQDTSLGEGCKAEDISLRGMYAIQRDIALTQECSCRSMQLS